MKITDRPNDLITSEAEWISSADVENALVSHPGVAEAAVIAVPDPTGQERPLAVVVLKRDFAATDEDLRALLARTFATWQLPDHFIFVLEPPDTSTGTLLKSELRRLYKDWKWRVSA